MCTMSTSEPNTVIGCETSLSAAKPGSMTTAMIAKPIHGSAFELLRCVVGDHQRQEDEHATASTG